MRAAWSLMVVLVACGKSPGAQPEAGLPDDAAIDSAPIDATPDSAPDALPPACATPTPGRTITMRKLAAKVDGIATLVTAAPNDLRLFVVQATGAIRIYRDEQLLPDPFLDLRAAVGGPVAYDGTELGLLGLAFHPSYPQNGIFFVYYTTGVLADNTLRDVVVRCSVSATDVDRADPASCTEILSIADPGRNHNGGMMQFGSDGLLYIGTGDGGGPAQLTTSQDPTKLLGKMLRIDVDHPAAPLLYGIPADNPYVAGGGAAEVFMLGLRNPWRWTFDAPTGDLWIGDVGRSAVEELDLLAPGEARGANLGWPMYEGSQCFQGPCDPAGKTFPKDERERTATGWAAIIGGQVYRGACYPDLVGWYLYGDEIVGAFALARPKPDRTLEIVDLVGTFPLHPTSIHADGRGEIYVTDTSGFVYHVEAAP